MPHTLTKELFIGALGHVSGLTREESEAQHCLAAW